MRKRNIGKPSVFLGSVLLASFCVGCNQSGNADLPETSDFEVWGAPATEKILQDFEDTQHYQALKEPVNLTIDTAKNDYENDQIIISANNKVKEYTLEFFDLQQVDGENVFKKENITAYNLGYCEITVPSCDVGTAGWYPDMLLPFDKAVEAGENTVEAGENQAIFFSFYTPDNQATGIYKGKIVLTVDGEKIDVPISLRVRNTTVSSVVHSKSRFSNTWHFFLGEYDGTQHMLDQYTEMMLDYYISPGFFMRDVTYTEENAKYYAEKAYEFGSRDDCSTICIPKRNYDTTVFATYIKAIAYKSIEKNYNLIKKCYALGPDEPAVHNNLAGMKQFAETFETGVNLAITDMQAEKEDYLNTHKDVDADFYDEVVSAIGEMRHVTTVAYREDYEPYVDIWCPLFHNFEPGYELGHYDNETELWFYGAISPRTPYPSYHITNTQINTRMIGWLQSIYNVAGNLYWSVNNYSVGGGGDSGFLDEYYETNPYHYPRFDGEGFLFYPGAKYGIDGPIPTLRLDAIRDGYEEYELMYALKETYQNVSAQAGVSFSADDVINDIAGSLYTGLKITATEKTFSSAKEQLLSLCEFSESGACFISHTDDGNGKIQYELYVPDGVTVTTEGLKVVSETVAQGGKIVKYEVVRETGVKTKAIFKTVVDGEEVAFERNLPGEIEIVSAEKFAGKLSGTLDMEKSVLTAGSTISAGLGEEQYLKLSLKEITGKGGQYIQIDDKDFVSKFGTQSEKATFTFYYTGEKALYVDVYVKYKNKTYQQKISSHVFQFAYGPNTIAWGNIYGINWATLGEVEYVRFYFGASGDPAKEKPKAREDLYFKNMVVYYVREEK